MEYLARSGFLASPARLKIIFWVSSLVISHLLTSLFDQDGWILASFFFCLFMVLDTHKHAKKELGQYPGGRGGTPLYGLCRYAQPKGYGISAVLVIKRVSILAILRPFW